VAFPVNQGFREFPFDRQDRFCQRRKQSLRMTGRRHGRPQTGGAHDACPPAATGAAAAPAVTGVALFCLSRARGMRPVSHPLRFTTMTEAKDE
jgi:hypothetical protein